MNSESPARTMTVITQNAFGGPDVLTLGEAPRPRPLATEVLVRVEAAGVNPVDWKTRAGSGMAGVLGEPPFILGWDVAGVVEEVGFGVTTLAVGDRVFGMPWFPRSAGAYAQYVTAPSRQFVKMPEGLSFEEAAAVPLAALTAWQALVDTAHVQSGQTVVVTAAAGGVGHFAVQFAHQLGARVIAVASARHHEWLRAHGAAEVVDYTQTRFEDEISGADAVIELVGGGPDDTTRRAVSTLRAGGILVAVPGGVSAPVVKAAAEAGVRTSAFLVEPDGAGMTAIAGMLARHEVVVEVAEVFELADAARAHQSGETGRTRGKIVLRVQH
ncbi:NADPH:quinone reductase-like Zn-dependent oxidoreductase [Microbacterium sp. W4I4]|uniref:NADP-dependent oxidoreductase n=1 Tax=Microbacterium sp. W4I4 TaxID=3042295 RepID=UPI00277DD740|nr:NADP-dependent oxidoreductase [Microbacterium sp. W4I4]MDQ0615704.1 NADPH:quinone reductase-like Zn-dependent oxidoreductase [Microbacterium sp. W4I4]